jgi:hypothetical protein
MRCARRGSRTNDILASASCAAVGRVRCGSLFPSSAPAERVCRPPEAEGIATVRQARSAGALFLVPIEPLEKVERFTAVFAGAFQRPPVSLLAFSFVGTAQPRTAAARARRRSPRRARDTRFRARDCVLIYAPAAGLIFRGSCAWCETQWAYRGQPIG